MFYPLKPENGFLPEEDFFSWITEQTDLIFLCSPHNPSGTVLSREFLLEAASRAEQCGAVLVVDECFWQFVTEEKRVTLLDAVNEHPSLFLLHAFTKTFAMPGLRLGYGVTANARLMENMERHIQAWNVSVPAQMAGAAALGETSYGGTYGCGCGCGAGISEPGDEETGTGGISVPGKFSPVSGAGGSERAMPGEKDPDPRLSELPGAVCRMVPDSREAS